MYVDQYFFVFFVCNVGAHKPHIITISNYHEICLNFRNRLIISVYTGSAVPELEIKLKTDHMVAESELSTA